jgi:hypothetical protein
MRINAPDLAKDRFEVYRFFNGLAVEGKDGLDQGRSRVPLVKTFLVEHVSGHSKRTPKSAATIFSNLGVKTRQIDETFLSIQVPSEKTENTSRELVTAGFVEQYDERFFAYHTVEPSVDARKLVRRWITQSPDLDSAWFSSQLLQTLWDKDVSQRGDNRFGKLSFKHESIFEMPDEENRTNSGDEENEDEDRDPQEEDEPDLERRKARFEMGDRIGRIKAALGDLQNNYAPLHALYSVRFPSRVGNGSHDLFQHGQITNRSDSFEDHRNTVRYLYRAYKSVLEATENVAWNQLQPPSKERPTGLNLKGVPLIVEFKEELTKKTFDRWMALAFQKKNQFRLWGEPIRLGPTKVHVYGADRHLWQPINLELTTKGMVAILPQGTCGNTFHRLVTNIQRYVCPNIEAWLGAKPFQSLADNMPSEKEVNNEV